MKKKSLFTLVAFAGLLAACSQEEFVSPAGEAKTDAKLESRPLLGDVTLDFGSANTRMAIDGSYSWKFEDGDEVGAAIVDAPETGNKTGYGLNGSTWANDTWTYAEYVKGTRKIGSPVKYLFTETKKTGAADGVDNTAEDMYVLNADNHISTNYPYLLKDGKFTSQANLVEGNYLFYAPYDQNHLTREPLVIVTPMVQDCSDSIMMSSNYKKQPIQVSSTAMNDFYKGTTKDFEKAPVAIGYNFLAAPADRTQAINATADMENIFAYPMITIANNYEGYLFDGEEISTSTIQKTAMKIDSILVYTTTNGKILYKQAVDVAKAKARLTDGSWKENKFTSDESNTASLFAASSAYSDPNYFGASKEAIKGSVVAKQSRSNQHIVCDLGGKELNYGEKYHFHMILPAENYEKNLYAEVYVKIGDKRYVIYQASDAFDVNAADAQTNPGKANLGAYSGSWSNWNFKDEDNGGMDARFVRGQHYPAPELLDDGTGAKNFAGTMMTINLTGGRTQAAFALAEKAGNYGFENNEDMIDYITGELQRGVDLVESNIASVARENWKTQVAGTPGAFAFAADTKCIINAELIAALRNRMYQNDDEGASIKLDTNLPIASDVKITASDANASDTDYTDYTFETLDGTERSYIVTLKNASRGTSATALKSGINVITGTGTTLKLGTGAANAVVYVPTGVSTTLASATGISGLYVNGGTLAVDAACDALVVLTGNGTIKVGQGGSLTNADNEFVSGTVSNTNLKTVAGTVENGVAVTAGGAGFPTAAIAASTQINEYIITLSDVTKALAVEQADIDRFANLSGVTISTNAELIESRSNVTMTNISKFESTAQDVATWSKAGTESVVVTYPANGSVVNINGGTDVEIRRASNN